MAKKSLFLLNIFFIYFFFISTSSADLQKNLINKLTAFEKYSSECEVRNAKDAEIHQELEVTSAKSRYLIEEVLIKLTKVEGIKY